MTKSLELRITPNDTKRGAQGGAQGTCAGAEVPMALGLPNYGQQDDKEASELARDYEITSPTRFASGAAFRALREIISMVEKKDMSCLQFGERHGPVIRKFLS
jgi:hypothetical protein